MHFLLYSAATFASVVSINAEQGVEIQSLTRNREYNFEETELKEELNDFGNFEEDWFRLVQDYSVPSITGCSYDVDLDCHLSDDLNVSVEPLMTFMKY